MKPAIAFLACLFALIIVALPCTPLVHAQSSSLQTLFAFSCDSSTKVCPHGEDASSLIESADGNFYGTAEFGGSSSQATGTVFKLTPAGQLTTIYTFTGSANGSNPTSLLEGNDGFLYGTTNAGGAHKQGVVFKLSKSGTIHILHSFCSLANCADGNQPFNLVLANDGNFYGCTTYSFPGTLFRITPTGSYTLLHTFNVAVDGPQCIGMMLASDGNLYGNTLGGFSFPTVLFRLTPAGQVTDVHAWRYSQFPVSPLTQTSKGSIWGVLTHTDITPVAEPGMFAVAPSGANYTEIPLFYPFNGNSVQFLIQPSDGNFWGTFGESIVDFTLGGKLLQQIAFPDKSTGPAALIQASDGRLLGFSNNNGFSSGGAGEIFAIEPSLAAPEPLFVSFAPSSGVVGSQIIIHGAHFVGATAVKFNGVSAKFQVLNTGNIKATVPLGATTGPIEVINKGGEGTSVKAYTVE